MDGGNKPTVKIVISLLTSQTEKKQAAMRYEMKQMMMSGHHK